MAPVSKSIVVVTGASSGIGKALAETFASRGHSVVLVARDAGRLRQLAEDLVVRYRIAAHVVPLDLAQGTAADQLLKATESLRVGILVNNAGFGVHGSFVETPLADEIRMVSLQIQNFLAITKGFAKRMKAEGQGKILNVSSVYGFVPVPQQSVYAACKAFMVSFSHALAHELKPDGIHVCVVCPGSTRTEFRQRLGIEDHGRISGMSADDVAREAYDALMSGRREWIPGLSNRVVISILRHLPGRWGAWALDRINRARGLNR